MAVYILALDQGTSSSRAILFNQGGNIVSVAQRELKQSYPQPGWVEHDAEEIAASQIAVMQEAVHQCGATAADIAAIGLTNQRETTVVWDRKTSEPICPAIVWQDRRTAVRCDQLKADGLAGLILAKTGLVLDPYFCATKIEWILDNIAGARLRAERGELAFGTVDSWLAWKLTGGLHITDESNASRTLLYNIHRHEWDAALLDLFHIPASLLPDVRPSSQVYGQIKAEFFGRPIPLAGMAGDQQAALFGQMCLRPGMIKQTYGTGGFMMMNTGPTPVASPNQLLATIAWKLGEKTTYALEGSVFVAGAVVQWLRDGLGLLKNAADVETLAASVPDSGGVYFVPAFAGLGAPHWDATARGSISGLTRGTTAAHLARAALESIAFQTADVLRAMQSDSGQPIRELRVDGGACANNLLMQIQANVLGLPLRRPRVRETTALGAAYLAGLAVGFWPSTAEMETHWQEERTFFPNKDAAQMASRLQGWEKAVERARHWLDD